MAKCTALFISVALAVFLFGVCHSKPQGSPTKLVGSLVQERIRNHHVLPMATLLTRDDDRIVDDHVITNVNMNEKAIHPAHSLIKRSAQRGYMARPMKSGGGLEEYQAICGRSKESFLRRLPTPYILNGTCGNYGDYPWVAQIQIQESMGSPDSDYVQHCGGTIISDTMILTAAHCLQGLRPEYLRVVVGQHHLNEVDPDERVFDIEEFAIHPDWDSPLYGSYSNDIALAKLRRKGDGQGISFSANVSPACVPESHTSFEAGMNCVIAGWGKTDTIRGSPTSECLMSASVPVIGNRKCRQLYAASSKKILESMTCAGYTEGGVDTCKGDSGGPLACKRDGQYHIYGVVSWGEGCGEKNKPGVYSKVQHFIDWIHQTVEEFK